MLLGREGLRPVKAYRHRGWKRAKVGPLLFQRDDWQKFSKINGTLISVSEPKTQYDLVICVVKLQDAYVKVRSWQQNSRRIVEELKDATVSIGVQKQFPTHFALSCFQKTTKTEIQFQLFRDVTSPSALWPRSWRTKSSLTGSTAV